MANQTFPEGKVIRQNRQAEAAAEREEQPLPERVALADPLQTEREQLAEQAKELSAHASHFAAGLIWSQPVADDAQRLATLARDLAHTATRVDELRGYKNPRH